jgi:hypothetical protein
MTPSDFFLHADTCNLGKSEDTLLARGKLIFVDPNVLGALRITELPKILSTCQYTFYLPFVQLRTVKGAIV